MKPGKPTALYYIALLPPEDIRQEVTALKEHAAEAFHSSKALNSPPHITLIPPFRIEISREAELLERVHACRRPWVSFPVVLDGFDHFSNEVIYVNVCPNPALNAFRAELMACLDPDMVTETARTRPFRPHMTVAFRDLTPDGFLAAWQYYGNVNYSRDFSAFPPVVLRHTGRIWSVIGPPAEPQSGES